MKKNIDYEEKNNVPLGKDENIEFDEERFNYNEKQEMKK